MATALAPLLFLLVAASYAGAAEVFSVLSSSDFACLLHLLHQLSLIMIMVKMMNRMTETTMSSTTANAAGGTFTFTYMYLCFGLSGSLPTSTPSTFGTLACWQQGCSGLPTRWIVPNWPRCQNNSGPAFLLASTMGPLRLFFFYCSYYFIMIELSFTASWSKQRQMGWGMPPLFPWTRTDTTSLSSLAG